MDFRQKKNEWDVRFEEILHMEKCSVIKEFIEWIGVHAYFDVNSISMHGT